ncbi:VOC family protein [Flagellimonas iocasae]|uniref:VOC family protein n=1 Tax=Flagellimonas iocasae TaxID=2055905 RepID=A0ABW4XX50_9FLAO
MKQIFINLPVKDPNASMAFYSELGFTNYPLFANNDQKCMVWSEQIYVMLQSLEIFQGNTEKTTQDTPLSVTAKFTLPVESLDRVNFIAQKGVNAVGVEIQPMKDEGFMQIRSIADLDGHHWDIIHLDMEKFKRIKT